MADLFPRLLEAGEVAATVGERREDPADRIGLPGEYVDQYVGTYAASLTRNRPSRPSGSGKPLRP